MKTDTELVKAFVGGDKHSFEELYNKYKDSLLRFLIHYVGNREMAEDMFQKSFVRFFENADKLAKKEHINFKSWMFKVAINLCKDEWKSSHHKKTESSNNQEEKFVSKSNLEEHAIQKWEIEKIQHALHNLSDKLRLTLTLYYNSNFSLAEISQTLHIPLGTVKSRLNKGVNLLIKELKVKTNENE